VQRDAGLDPDLCLVPVANNQLSHQLQTRLLSECNGMRTSPSAGAHDDPHSPVRMAPDVLRQAGDQRNQHRGAVGHVESGEDLTEVAEAFDLEVDDVRWALAYETSMRAA